MEINKENWKTTISEVNIEGSKFEMIIILNSDFEINR